MPDWLLYLALAYAMGAVIKTKIMRSEEEERKGQYGRALLTVAEGFVAVGLAVYFNVLLFIEAWKGIS